MRGFTALKLHEAVDAVTDPQSFLNFVRELIADREDEVRKEKVHPSPPYGAGANGWENGSIASFLEAAVAWADDSDFVEKQNLPGNNPWQQFANFLYAGKIYE
jgi:hypothetical protein